MGGGFSIPKSPSDTSLVKVMMESIRIFPDTVIVGTGVFALFTLSIPFAVMFLGLLEASALFHALKYISTFLGDGDNSDSRVSGRACSTGFSSVSLRDVSIFSSKVSSTYPSAPLYIICVAAAYIFSSLNAQSEQLQALGPAYSSRYYISLSLLSTLIILFALFRFTQSCDSLSVILGTIPIGLAVGAVLLLQNSRLFGAESINLIGIPSLAGVTATGKSLYVCPTVS
jgi:hypothetical protein